MKNRCSWCTSDPLYIHYHDYEWGVPVHEERLLFEFLSLEGAQAGLSWITILKKRENYKKAFDNFECETIAKYDDSDVERLLSNPGIVRNKLKVKSVVTNAQMVLKIKEEFGSFDKYLWDFVDGKTIQNEFYSEKDIPVATPVSTALSKDLKKRGFKFVGPIICYAFMQAIGMVNDHVVGCFRHNQLKRDN